MDVSETKKKLEDFKRSLPTIVASILKDLAPQIEQMNRAQLAEGRDADGKKTPRYKSRDKTGRIKFRDTGDYYRSINAEVRGQKLSLESQDKKEKYLNPWKGVIPTLGLSPQNMLRLQQLVDIKLSEMLNNLLNS